jgi:uncharacterized protein YqgV (UPF0045/DUF77 family)
MPLAAQVSLYPLRQPHLSPAIEHALEVFRQYGLEVQPGSMSSIVMGEEEPLFDALRTAFLKAAEEGEVVMVVTLSNACPVPETR